MDKMLKEMWMDTFFRLLKEVHGANWWNTTPNQWLKLVKGDAKLLDGFLKKVGVKKFVEIVSKEFWARVKRHHAGLVRRDRNKRAFRASRGTD